MLVSGLMAKLTDKAGFFMSVVTFTQAISSRILPTERALLSVLTVQNTLENLNKMYSMDLDMKFFLIVPIT